MKKAGLNRMNIPKWSDEPKQPGFYVVFQRGRGMDVLFWDGEESPIYEKFETKALYFGPFRLPFAV